MLTYPEECLILQHRYAEYHVVLKEQALKDIYYIYSHID